MDSDLGASLSFLYKNDPFYSLCLSDLMTAPQRVTNQFLKDQRHLTESLRRIDHCQLSRITQLNEEKKHFALLMRRRLAQGTSHFSPTGRESKQSFSTKTFTDLSSVKSSTHGFDTLASASTYSTQQSVSLPSSSTLWNNSGTNNVKGHFFVTSLPVDRGYRGRSPKLVTKSERCFSAIRSENIGKTISRTAYRVK